ncbi:hypothetical protein K438DRAFT_1960823 [Mycena galopus ATCC 62051]|nr:hypothetical protein K438DRAFT_1960823 [Mycena galopus ATCC 62051]
MSGEPPVRPSGSDPSHCPTASSDPSSNAPLASGLTRLSGLADRPAFRTEPQAAPPPGTSSPVPPDSVPPRSPSSGCSHWNVYQRAPNTGIFYMTYIWLKAFKRELGVVVI